MSREEDIAEARRLLQEGDRGRALTPEEWEALPQWRKNRTPRPPPAPKPAPAPKPPPAEWPPHSPRLLGERDWRGYFGRVIVVNLDRRPDRYEAFASRIGDDWPFAFPERVAALDGSLITPVKGWSSGRGAYGLWSTYRRILEDVIHLRCNAPVLFLEDDCEFVPDFGALASRALAYAPEDWDLFFLGCQHRGEFRPVNDHVVRAGAAHRTHSFAVAPHFFRALYRIWSVDPGHVDHAITRVCSFHKVFAAKPNLTAQAAGSSNISGRSGGRYTWDPHTAALLK